MPRDPARLDRRPRQPAIERHPALCDDEWAPSDNPFIEGLVNLRAFISQNTLSHVHTSISQLHDAFAGVPRVYVSRTDNHVSNTSAEYCICAWCCAPRGRTRLEGNVQRGPRGHRCTEIAKALDLSVIASRFPMVSLRYYSIVYDQDRSNGRIRARLAKRLSCLV
jgi:hypothetical protein